MAIVTGIGDGTIDGGQAEWAANEVLRDAGTPRLYYATPVAIERTGDLIESVTVACPEGLRRIVARQWIDATEEGRLARLCGTAQSPRPPARRLAYVMLQRREWPGGETVPVPLTEFPGVRAVWQASHWTAERALRIEAPGCGTPPLSALLTSGLAALRKLIGTTCDDAFVSHASYTFYPEYEAGTAAASPAANLALAVPGLAQQPVRTLCDRYELGCAALARIAGQPCAAAGLRPTPPTPPKPEDVLEAPVVVAGLGTAGALAAIAAGRSGARVLAFEEQPFPGGVAVACCIHAYYYGCPGGLQEEIDDEVAKLMPLFARRKEWPAGYHPHARRAVLERLLAAADVETHYGCRLVEVTRDGGRIVAATVATPDGIRTVRAEAWIDATGEATLCHTAGVPSRLGRASDGNLHVYTQSCSAYSYREHQFTAFINNSDTGFVDPNDARDMTRARIEGLHDYKLQVTNAFNRATGMVPAIGIRQGRLVATDYRLTLDDLLERRRFDDAIGFTGGHYDSHADDFFAGSDAAAMLVWGGCWVPARPARSPTVPFCRRDSTTSGWPAVLPAARSTPAWVSACSATCTASARRRALPPRWRYSTAPPAGQSHLKNSGRPCSARAPCSRRWRIRIISGVRSARWKATPCSMARPRRATSGRGSRHSRHRNPDWRSGASTASARKRRAI